MFGSSQLVLDFFLIPAFAENSLADIHQHIISGSTSRRLQPQKLIAAVVCSTIRAEQNPLVHLEHPDV
jgi:hypothetical protein